jgi:hypothetical protein
MRRNWNKWLSMLFLVISVTMLVVVLSSTAGAEGGGVILDPSADSLPDMIILPPPAPPAAPAGSDDSYSWEGGLKTIEPAPDSYQTGIFAPPPPISGENLLWKWNTKASPKYKPVPTPQPEVMVLVGTPIPEKPNITMPAGGFGGGGEPGGYGGGGDGDSPSLDKAFRTPDIRLTPVTNVTPGINMTVPTTYPTLPFNQDTPPGQIGGGDRIPPGDNLANKLNEAREQGSTLSQAGKPDAAELARAQQNSEAASVLAGFRSVAVGKTLPAATTMIPPQKAGLLALAITVTLSALGALFEQRSPKRWSKTVEYSRNFLGNYGIGVAGTNESKLRKTTVTPGQPLFLGLSRTEVMVVLVGAVAYGLAFLVAKKEWMAPGLFLMYIVSAGVAITIHEVGHRYIAKKYRDEVELKLWDIGILTMFITGLITGIVFAKPSKNVIASAAAIPKEQMGRIMLAGPVISVLASLVFVPFLFLGGVYQVAASMSIMFNLIVGTYHLMPFTPMDGRSILRWNGVLWFVIFVPLVVAYFFLFMG